MLQEGFVKNLANYDHSSIILFTLFLGGMVGIIYKNGGMEGLVSFLKRYVKSKKSAQVTGWIMGILIFFDDYANTLLVGNTLRPLTDTYKISREKLSYIVDSTAAPVTSIALISTWIGYEISLISESFSNLGISENPYLFFIRTIPYRFYPIFALFFGFLIAYSLRDFGPMFKAEKRAFEEGKVVRDGSNPLGFQREEKVLPSSPFLAIIPIIFVFFGCFLMLYVTGIQNLGY
ncbi:MAG: Na+/H+ antiporter NhaC family protein, partial [Thermoanaerobaculia bacterium]